MKPRAKVLLKPSSIRYQTHWKAKRLSRIAEGETAALTGGQTHREGMLPLHQSLLGMQGRQPAAAGQRDNSVITPCSRDAPALPKRPRADGLITQQVTAQTFY